MGAIHSGLIFDSDSDLERASVGGTDLSSRQQQRITTSDKKHKLILMR